MVVGTMKEHEIYFNETLKVFQVGMSIKYILEFKLKILFNGTKNNGSFQQYKIT